MRESAVMKKMKTLEKIRLLLYPPKCLNCGEAIPSGCLCDDCLEKIKPNETSFSLDGKNTMRVISCQSYTDGFRDSVQAFKFSGAYRMSDDFAELMRLNLEEWEIEADIITFVPMTKSRERKRGYNQAQRLAESLSAKINVPCLKLLKKNRNNLVQHSLNAEERKRNVVGVYDFSSENYIKDRTIILVDDIITTGATIIECAKVLYESGAKEVFGICAAYSVSDGTLD